ncbi:hypothetical protein DPMN_088916 [Dreissena polymorpha]|nr:hypothetical protein DPMN_088916 [Dreissena polymorpha]
MPKTASLEPGLVQQNIGVPFLTIDSQCRTNDSVPDNKLSAQDNYLTVPDN